MATGYPNIIYTEEGMREGMQIESKDIPIDAKVALLDALSETGLKRIVVGSFVSPKYTPQMARIDELMHKFHPKPGVTYLALALNEKGIERAQEYSPPLTTERINGWTRGRPRLFCHMCDVFARRKHQPLADAGDGILVEDDCCGQGERCYRGRYRINATFGSNFVGDFRWTW